MRRGGPYLRVPSASRRVSMRRLVLLALALVLSAVAPARAQRSVAVTLDDLPYAGGTLAEAAGATGALLDALAAHGAPADVFVIGASVDVEGEAPARRALVRRWQEAGHRLHNHSYTHPAFSRVQLDAYLEDVARGERAVAALRGDRPGPAYYRPPYNDLGDSAETRRRLADALAVDGVRLAPFTVEHSDWMFDAVYRDALGRGDTARAARVGAAYLAQLDAAFDFAESLSEEMFGRPIPHVLLLHANALNAAYLGDMLARLAARGYGFVDLAAAVADSAYATEDAYLQPWGVSWLHRWRVVLGLPDALRQEPEPPAWIVEAHAAL